MSELEEQLQASGSLNSDVGHRITSTNDFDKHKEIMFTLNSAPLSSGSVVSSPCCCSRDAIQQMPCDRAPCQITAIAVHI